MSLQDIHLLKHKQKTCKRLSSITASYGSTNTCRSPQFLISSKFQHHFIIVRASSSIIIFLTWVKVVHLHIYSEDAVLVPHHNLTFARLDLGVVVSHLAQHSAVVQSVPGIKGTATYLVKKNYIISLIQSYQTPFMIICYCFYCCLMQFLRRMDCIL